MSPFVVLQVANLFFNGILAGTEFTIHYGLSNCAAVLSDQSQLQLRQALIQRLRVLVPAIFVPAAVTGIFVTTLDGASSGFWWRCAGLLAVFLWILVRAIGTVPINKATLSWQPGTTPENWKALVAHAERFHIVGTWAAIFAFLFFLIAAAV